MALPLAIIYRLKEPEQALGGTPLGLGLVIEDKLTCTCIIQILPSLYRYLVMLVRPERSEAAAHTSRVVRLCTTFIHFIRFFFASQDEDSGDSDNEAEEQRKVCQLSTCYCRLCAYVEPSISLFYL